MRSVETLEGTTFCGRRFTKTQLARVQETVQSFPSLTRNELALTVCEHLNWKTPKGSYKKGSCLRLLDELDSRGVIDLPDTRKNCGHTHSEISFKEADAAVASSLDALGPVSLVPVTTAEERALWKSYVESHHYLGYKRPIGSHLLYFIVSGAQQQKLGCMSFSATAAWALGPRDHWIGWDERQREKLRHLVLCQSRFLIFPWVNVPNLGSKVLSLATKRVGDDWVRAHGYRPVLVETFVDTTKFLGTSYRAANWRYLGETEGRGQDLNGARKTQKAIFAYPLQANYRQCLTQGHPGSRTKSSAAQRKALLAGSADTGETPRAGRGGEDRARSADCGRRSPCPPVEGSSGIATGSMGRRLRQTQQPQGTPDVPIEGPTCGGDVLDASQAQQADRHVAQGRHDMGAVSLANLGAVLVVGHVTHVVQSILDLPVGAVVAEHLRRRCSVGGEARQTVDGFLGGLAPLDDVPLEVGSRASNAEDLSDIREVEVAVEFSARPDLARLEPAVALVVRAVLRGEKPPLPEASCARLAGVSLPPPARRRSPRCPCAASAGCPWP